MHQNTINEIAEEINQRDDSRQQKELIEMGCNTGNVNANAVRQKVIVKEGDKQE